MAAIGDDDAYDDCKSHVPAQLPKRIAALQFGLLSPQDIVAQSVVEVADRNIYDLPSSAGGKRTLTKHGLNDPRMGTSSKTGKCAKCGEDLKNCNGHFGHVRLALPAFHYGYLKRTIEVLSCICKQCSNILLPELARRKHLASVRRPGLDGLRREAICKNIASECKKTKICPHCRAHNGPIRKVAGHPVKIFHAKFNAYHTSAAKSKQPPQALQEFDRSFDEARKGNAEVERHMKRGVDDMNPLKALNLFRRISGSDVELLGIDPERGRPEMFIWQYIPAPPVAIRPSVAQDNASTEDDITNKLGDIVQINNYLRAAIQSGQALPKITEIWEYLQVQIAMYIEGNLPGLGRDSAYGKPLRGFNQRLKGKQGRFRGNLSGKRVDFSGRTVISPDPNLGIDEVAVPSRVAVNMTYPEKVNQYNIDKLRLCIRRGDKKHPGANFIVRHRTQHRIVIRAVALKGSLDKVADQLEIGDTVERHLEDGDIVLFNRQPSLHKLSILSHRVKVRPWRTFRLNECVCNPYNADFDGDEMNLHVPQTEEARSEALELMGVKHNLATPKNGTPIIAAIQDFITCAYLSTNKDRFFSRRDFTQIVSTMFNGDAAVDPRNGKRLPIEIPPPTIRKPVQLWTGKQIWSVLIRPHHKYGVHPEECPGGIQVNLEAKGKQYSDEEGVPPDLNMNDSYLVIRNSEVMCGTMDKATVGDGKKDSVFYVIMRDFGPDYAVQAMNRLAKLSARWLTNVGFSIGISDVYPSAALTKHKERVITTATEKVNALIATFQKGNLKRSPGCDEEATLEIEISGILNKVRQQCGEACSAELSRNNAPMTMAKCGSKGSDINVAQMIATVGQQIIDNKRVVDGFQDRTLPHFSKNSRDPPAKGFVANSFFSGLDPTEFIFHAMSGREGLVDTAVKTAETGYMSRRLMKSLEDLSVQYDDTVRNSSSGVVQFQYGDDKLDPVDMEGTAKPVNFGRTFMHAVSSTWNNSEPGMTQRDIAAYAEDVLGAEKKKLGRTSLIKNELLDYHDSTDHGVDQFESAREFLDTVETFIATKANRVASTQARMPGTSILKISRTALREFLRLCLRKYETSIVQPGHAVGAVGAQSIGEPGTQMTLKTFHFAGVAGMNLTQGVPRIKEIINASKIISTPLVTCPLDSKYDDVVARRTKALIEKTYLGDIVAHVEDVWHVGGCYLNMRVNWRTVRELGLIVTMSGLVKAIEGHKGMKTLGVQAKIAGDRHIRVYLKDPASEPKKGRATRGTATTLDDGKSKRVKEDGINDSLFIAVHRLKRKLPYVVVRGYPDAQRAIMKRDDRLDATDREPISLLVEGYGLKACMTTPGVDGRRTTTNSIMEVRDVLGIEAARTSICVEIAEVMGSMGIDPRHMQLLADVMTYKGDVLGITRFGLAKMRDSVLQLASFEKTPDHLFEAAARLKEDRIEGVSECIIMGQSMSLGTGAMKVLRPLEMREEDFARREADFSRAWRSVEEGRKARARERREMVRAVRVK